MSRKLDAQPMDIAQWWPHASGGPLHLKPAGDEVFARRGSERQSALGRQSKDEPALDDTARRSSLSYAFLCALALPLAALIAHPVAEIGISDDFSYVKSARVLAATGHIQFFGWNTPILGWQLYLGALFAKLFGPSFTAIRSSTLLMAMATAFLMHRVLIRAGVNSRNATIGTLCLVFSPLFFPLAFTFMTDIGGLFCLALCLYACLRAMQGETDRAVLFWLTFAAVSNALGGTERQIAWLGVLLMVPSTVWLLRRRRYVVPIGIALYLGSAAFIAATLHWFQNQPYSQSESLAPERLDLNHLYPIGLRLLSFLFSCVLFLLPVTAAFVQTKMFRNRRTSDFLIVSGVLCLLAALAICMLDPHNFGVLLAPYAGDTVTQSGLLDCSPLLGRQPVILSLGVRIVLTCAVVFTSLCLLAFARNLRDRSRGTGTSKISWNSLLILVVPYLIGYCALLVPRSTRGLLFDRYLLPILVIGLVLLLRLFQDFAVPRLPPLSIALTAIFAIFAVAGTHDAFSMYRARAAAIAELRAAGIPDTSIDGGFEQNGMTQIEQAGYMNDPRIQIPRRVFVTPTAHFPAGCAPWLAYLTPVIVPGFSLSYDKDTCGGNSQFAPISYSNWLERSRVSVYIVRTEKTAEEGSVGSAMHATRTALP